VLSATLAHGKVVLSAAAQQQLGQALGRPVSVYSADARAGEVILGRVDLWAGKQMDLRKAKTSSSKNAARTSFLAEEKENRPVWPERSQKKGVVARELFLVRYVKEPGMRSFVKDLHVPTLAKLARTDVVAIAERLIEANGFCRTTSTDRRGEAQVVSRVRLLHAGSGGKADSTFTLFQRVILKRQLSGLEVVNSKQVVDVHPSTREILAYKNIDWTPVVEASAQARPYKTRERVLAEIDSAFAGSSRLESIVRIELCYYQADSLILPVLAVHPQRDTGETGIEGVLYIGLTNVDIGQPGAKNPRQPTSAR